jgi:hypothetical protein
VAAQPPAASAVDSMSDADIERFLQNGKVIKTRSAPKGVTNSIRAVVSDGSITHEAHIQMVEEKRATGPAGRGGTELNFRDSWTFNIAAYRLDRLIGLNMVPVSVEIRYRTQPAAITWWIDDVMMDEGERIKRKAAPPRPLEWSERMALIGLFDQLIYNMDRNMGNLLIAKDWRVWAIDHTRAFRLHKEIRNPSAIMKCDRDVFEKLKQLDADVLNEDLGKYLTEWERNAILARRDQIIAILEKRGEGAFFTRQWK